MQTPFEQKQATTNTFSPVSIADTQEAKDFLGLPLNFGGGNYGGEAYKDIKNDFTFNLDPGVGRRAALAEQEINNRYNAVGGGGGGVSGFIREARRAKELREARGQGAYERQQAEYGAQQGKQQAEFQSSLARAQMRDSSELARARMADDAATQRTLAELQRRQTLLPNIYQTGGSGSSSGFNTQLTQPTPGFFSSFGSGLGAGIGSALQFPKI